MAADAKLLNDRTFREEWGPKPRALEDQFHDVRKLLESTDRSKIREAHYKLIELSKKFVLRSMSALTEQEALVAIKYFVNSKSVKTIAQEMDIPYSEARIILLSTVRALNQRYKEDLLPELPHIGRKIFYGPVAQELNEFVNTEIQIPEMQVYACEFQMSLY